MGPLEHPGVRLPGAARRDLHRQQHHAAEEEPRRPRADPRPDRPASIGALTTLLVLIKGLPLAYNRDLQEDKEPLFDAFDTVEACLELAAVVVDGASLRADRIAERLDEGFLDATTLMEYLIRKGVPQRTAHEVIGHLVGLCEQPGPEAPGRPARRRASPRPIPALGPGVRAVLGVANAVKAFRSYGSTAPAEVEKQLSAGRVHSVPDPRGATRRGASTSSGWPNLTPPWANGAPETAHEIHRDVDRDEDGAGHRMPCQSRLRRPGESKEHALENIKDAIKLCLEVRAEEDSADDRIVTNVRPRSS